MKPTKLILILSFVWCLVLWCSGALVFAADLQVESGGKLKSETFTFNEQTTDPTAQEGRVVYKNDQTYVYGTSWQAMDDAKTIATRIVGVGDRNGNGQVDAGESRLTGKTADYICGDGTYPTDQQYINTAITEVANARGGAVYLLEGTYNISSSINMAANVALIGTGAGTVLNQTATSITIINVSDVNNIFISKLKIKGNGSTAGANYAISLNNTDNSKISNLWIETIEACISLDSADNNTIVGNHFNNNNSSAISTVGSSNNTIHNNVFDNNGSAVLISGSQAASPVGTNNTVSANTITGIGSMGILLQYTNNNIISTNSIDAVSAGNKIGIKLIAYYFAPLIYYPCDYNIISGNIIKFASADTQSNGIEIEYAKNNSILNNLIEQAGNNGIYIWRSSASGNLISGNMIYEPYSRAITLGSGPDDNIIFSNRIYKAADAAASKYGISIFASQSDNNYLVGNYVDGAGYIGSGYDRRIEDSGTNTQYTGKEKITLEPVTYVPLDGGTIDLSATGIGPTTYIRLNPAVADVVLNITNAISDGKATGDLLILENITANRINLKDGANVQLSAAERDLYQNDTLKLIWNGTDWLEVSFANN